jgi:hypothetical protein
VAHYAFLDENNIVTQVIFGTDETELIEGLDTETWYGTFRGQVCKRTSYNGNYRKNYASVGDTYDENLDAFVAPQPYNSWVLDKETATWQPPVAYPNDNKMHTWNEDALAWDAIETGEN